MYMKDDGIFGWENIYKGLINSNQSPISPISINAFRPHYGVECGLHTPIGTSEGFLLKLPFHFWPINSKQYHSLNFFFFLFIWSIQI